MKNTIKLKKVLFSDQLCQLLTLSGNDCDIFTPVSSFNKRGASSSTETRPEKRPKGKPTDTAQLKDEGWKTVKNKKTARKEKNEGRKAVKEGREAVIIQPTEGRSYADVLRNIRS